MVHQYVRYSEFASYVCIYASAALITKFSRVRFSKGRWRRERRPAGGGWGRREESDGAGAGGGQRCHGSSSSSVLGCHEGQGKAHPLA